MAVTFLSETEGQPSAWPPVPGHDGDLDAVWQRVEAWITYRWRARPVVYVVEGPGEWVPRLGPFTLGTVQRWDGSKYVTVTLLPGPLGFMLDGYTYRVTGTAGDTSTPPPAVLTAVSRLAEYMDTPEKHPGASAYKTGVGPLDIEEQRSPAWLAKALAYSGAADLLRPYRRLS